MHKRQVIKGATEFKNEIIHHSFTNKITSTLSKWCHVHISSAYSQKYTPGYNLEILCFLAHHKTYQHNTASMKKRSALILLYYSLQPGLYVSQLITSCCIIFSNTAIIHAKISQSLTTFP